MAGKVESYDDNSIVTFQQDVSIFPTEVAIGIWWLGRSDIMGAVKSSGANNKNKLQVKRFIIYLIILLRF